MNACRLWNTTATLRQTGMRLRHVLSFFLAAVTLLLCVVLHALPSLSFPRASPPAPSASAPPLIMLLLLLILLILLRLVPFTCSCSAPSPASSLDPFPASPVPSLAPSSAAQIWLNPHSPKTRENVGLSRHDSVDPMMNGCGVSPRGKRSVEIGWKAVRSREEIEEMVDFVSETESSNDLPCRS